MNDGLHFGVTGLSFPDMLKELSSQLHTIHQQIGTIDTYGLRNNIQDIQDDKKG